MAKWNFFVSNASLIKELDTSGNDVNPQSQSFLAPTLDLQGAKIVFKDNGAYKTALLFTEIGTIDGDTPTDLQDAYDKIIALIPNSGGGGGSVGTLQQVTNNGKTTTNYIETGNVTATDVIGDTAPFTGNYSPSSSPSDKLMRFDDIDTGNVLNIKTIKPNDAVRDVYIQGISGILAYVSDIPAEVPNITITTSISIDTDTTGSGYGQHGRNTKISNGANAINLTVQTSSNADFIASYTKIGSATITFVAGSGTTLVQLSGTAILNGAVGSTACLTRNGNVYYLQITNY